jgi:hypothetical protein
MMVQRRTISKLSHQQNADVKPNEFVFRSHGIKSHPTLNCLTDEGLSNQGDTQAKSDAQPNPWVLNTPPEMHLPSNMNLLPAIDVLQATPLPRRLQPRKIPCSYPGCKLKLQRQSYYVMHLTSHNIFKCDSCSKEFGRADNLMIHMRQHVAEWVEGAAAELKYLRKR